MVIQHGQRIAAARGTLQLGEVAFEVHLPQVVGRGMNEALAGPMLGSGARESRFLWRFLCDKTHCVVRQILL